VELKATEVVYVGKVDASVYPLAKKKQSFEFMREVAHLRPRTNTIGAVARIRNALAYATHVFFQQRGFVYVHTPIITTSDCEGAGEMFQVVPHNRRIARGPAISESDLPGQPVRSWKSFVWPLHPQPPAGPPPRLRARSQATRIPSMLCNTLLVDGLCAASGCDKECRVEFLGFCDNVLMFGVSYWRHVDSRCCSRLWQ
jgi:tRNA synthetases class II (D, K and N)